MADSKWVYRHGAATGGSSQVDAVERVLNHLHEDGYDIVSVYRREDRNSYDIIAVKRDLVSQTERSSLGPK